MSARDLLVGHPPVSLPTGWACGGCAEKFVTAGDYSRHLAELLDTAALGYLVVAKRGDHNTSVGPVWSRRDRAVAHQQRVSTDRDDHPSYWHGAEFVLTAVREEQP